MKDLETDLQKAFEEVLAGKRPDFDSLNVCMPDFIGKLLATILAAVCQFLFIKHLTFKVKSKSTN